MDDDKEEEKNGGSEEKNDESGGGEGGGSADADEIESRKKKLPKGDYVIQVHIIEARDLQPRDFGDTSDPVCEVSVMGSKKSTSIHKESLNVVFDERLTFDFKNLEPEQVNQGKCTIECYDANVVRKNVLIGTFEFDLSGIYYEKHHELYKQWIALTDVTNTNQGVQGYLQVTLVVLGPSDEQYIHPPEEEFDMAGSLLNVMMPPQVDTKPFLLKVYIRQVEKLMVMDILSKSSDPYVVIKFAGAENKTSVFKKKLDVYVHECVSLPVMEPVLGDSIIIHVMDHDMVDSNDIIGTVTFSYKDIKAHGELGLENQWRHLYGGPQGKNRKTALKMNKGFIEGTTFRGSMMLSMTVEECDEPKKETVKAQWHKKMAPKIEQWVLQIDIYQAVEVYDGKGKFQIMMCIRNLKIKTEWADCKKGMCEWYEVLRLPDSDSKEDSIDLRMPKDPKQCPDVIFYLIEKKTGLNALDKKENIISYMRFKWTDLLKFGFTEPPHWYSFKQTPVLKKMKEEEFPGTVLIGLRVGIQHRKPQSVSPLARPFLNINTQESQLDLIQRGNTDLILGGPANVEQYLDEAFADNSNAENQPLMATRNRSLAIKSPSKRGDAETYGTLAVTVVNANGVPTTDRDGLSDPYVEVVVGKITQKTSVQKNTLRPTWNETFRWKGISIHDSIKISLNDWNRFGKKTVIGAVGNILLMGILQEARGELGEDFNHTKRFFVSEVHEKCTVTISISFDFDAKAFHDRAAREKKQNSNNIFKKPAALFTQHKAENKMANVTIMGRPYPRNYKMVAYVYQARALDALDESGFSDPYFEVSYCGKRAKTETIKRSLNPQWMEHLTLNVDVPQPAEYAPRIRCSVYDWDMLSKNDLIGRIFVDFTDVIEMMKTRKPRWYTLYDHHGDELEGRCYIAIEFIDASQKAPPIFNIDKTTKPYFLHLLTIGVRSMRSAFGVFKPQIVYSAPIAGQVEEIKTRPSSDPSANNANFLIIQKLPVKMPIDYELAPVINIVARDNLFGGLITRSIGNSIVDLHRFMKAIPFAPKGEWLIRDTKIEILNENELYAEIAAEDRAERREFMAEQRMQVLSQRKAIELTEARCQNRAFNQHELGDIKHMEGTYVEIENSEQYRERCFAEEDAILRQQEEDERILQEQIQARRERDDRTRKLELGKNAGGKIEDGQTKTDGGGAGAGAGADGDAKDEEEDANAAGNDGDGGGEDENEQLLTDNEGNNTDGGGLTQNNIQKAEDGKDGEEEEDEYGESASTDDTSDGGSFVPEETEKDLSKKEKKKAEKEKKKNEEQALKDWDKEDEEACFDLDSKVQFNPSDFEPEYLHGRPRIHNELEDEMDCDPFDAIELWTGAKGGIKLFGGGRRCSGKIKGLWKLSEDSENPFGNGLAALVQTRTIAVRLYILDGINLVSTDRDNSSDPYLVIKLGPEKISTRSRYIPNTLQPKFHEAIEFHTTLPGPSHITVEVWDWDGIGDDLVGKTVIDIEDRWFSKDWRRMKVKPLEERTLHNPRSQASFGKLRLWVDLFTKDNARNKPLIDISLPPKQHFEFRLIVWKAKDVVIKDELTDQNDLRCTVKMNVDEILKQETDIHWRAKFGKGSWNWRCVFPIVLPFEKRTSLHLSLWDQDVFSASDSIGEVNFSLDLLLRHAYLHIEELPKIILRKDQTKRFWLHMMHSKWPGESQGQVQVSMEIMTSEESAKIPAGLGRGDPNQNPFLPKPEGRFNFSLNPFDMLRQLLGNKCYAKLCGCIVCLACIAILIFFGPQLFITFMSNLIVGA